MTFLGLQAGDAGGAKEALRHAASVRKYVLTQRAAAASAAQQQGGRPALLRPQRRK